MGAFVSRFASFSKAQARLVLLALAAAILAGVALSLAVPAPASSVGGADGHGDMALYNAIIDRMKDGESYYPAAAEELRANNYALRPVLNFRLPTLATFLAALPQPVALILLRTLAAGVILAWFIRLRRAFPRPTIALAAGVIAFTGAGVAFSDAALVWHEVWAGLLLALALAVYGQRTWGYSAILCLCAVLIRELALPVPLILLALSIRERRFTEAAAWLAVIAAFGVTMLIHMNLATQQLLPSDQANSWTALGGWSFVLSSARWNLFLLTAPLWLNAILLPVAMLGLAGWNDRFAGRAALALAGWLGAFLIVGRPDNHYWGLMYAPLAAVGFAVSAPSLLALLRKAEWLPAQSPAKPVGTS